MFPNHYHFVAHCGSAPESLRRMLGALHANSAAWINRLDRTPGRRVWHNFWETKLTSQGSYLARLAYVHRNAVKHGLVTEATDYHYCSATWFEHNATRAQLTLIHRMKIDRIPDVECGA
jgi:putative transposase